MKKMIAMVVLLMVGVICSFAQDEERPFKADLRCGQYAVTFHIDLYEESVTIPGQEFLGPVSGYLEGRINGTWYVVKASIDGNVATVKLINDGGSETQDVQLTYTNDGTYVFAQKGGVEICYPKNRKYVKLPAELTFTRIR